MTKTPKIVLIGAGSRSFGLAMFSDLYQKKSLAGATLSLVDIDTESLEEMKVIAEKLNPKTGMGLNITSHTDRREALVDADFVIISVAIDRINRWQKDLEISRKHGLIQCQGECSAPGGLSLAFRNIPLILDICHDIESIAPEAWVINFSNPLSRVCLAINKYTNLKNVGLCHGLLGMKNLLTHLLGIERNELVVRGAGINHFNWLYDIHYSDGSDAYPDIKKRFLSDTPKGFTYTAELLDTLGYIVSPDDIHISDFIHHWTVEERSENVHGLKEKNMQMYFDSDKKFREKNQKFVNGQLDIEELLKGMSGEGAMDIIEAITYDKPYTEIAVNIPNRGYIPNLPDGSLVEVPAEISGRGIRGLEIPELPVAIKSFCSRQIDMMELSVEAAHDGDYQKALQALLLDPLVRDVSNARAILDETIQSHHDIIRPFKSAS